jgi:predicted RND superfamily exporter protein
LLDDRALRSLPADLQPVAKRFRERTRLVPVALDDLPPRLVKAFREKDGQTGRLVLVYPTLVTNAQHGRLQLAFARTLREVVHKTDPTALVAGQLILSADIVESITRGGSLAAALSFAAVGLLTLIILRSLRDAAWVLGSLCLGTLWMAGAFGALEVKLNFVNFVVLPITFGIGVDYAVNFYQRFRQAPGPHRAAQALAASGGAVALCSATTILGYSALLIADSRAIHSFGLTAVIGEITCLSAALFALPAILTWRERD